MGLPPRHAPLGADPPWEGGVPGGAPAAAPAGDCPGPEGPATQPAAASELHPDRLSPGLELAGPPLDSPPPPTNSTVTRLNDLARHARIAAGELDPTAVVPTPGRGEKIVGARVHDATGAITAVWFNQG